ncbi:MAG TPA: NUDIX hydrolase [Thermomicrobiales bacterium]|nr:NUDIX hydrolase [Thermomicrobiales bacterium]
MTLLRLAQDDMLFHVRIAAVCLHDGHVLLQGSVHEGFWILPGGHCELLEPTSETVRREMREEYDVEVDVGRLLWVVENFFTYERTRTHQIAFLYEVHLPDGSDLLDVANDITGIDGDVPFVARWFPIDSLSDVWLLPSFLREALKSLPETPQHIVHLDAEH